MLNPAKLLYQSLTQPDIYPIEGRHSLLSLLGYTLICYLSFALILSTYFTLRFVPSIKTSTLSSIAALKSNYPAELVLNFSNHQLNLPAPDQNLVITTDLGSLVFMPEETASPAALPAAPLLTFQKNAAKLLLPNLPEPLTFPYQDLGLEASFTAPQVISLLDQLAEAVQNLTPIVFILTLTLGLITAYLPLRLIYAAFTAGLFYLVGSLTKIHTPYRVYLKLFLLALVAAESINLVTILIYGQPTPIVFTLAFVGYTFIAVYTTTKNKTQS